jgi:tetratricopeptide (TPR) repeat protein
LASLLFYKERWAEAEAELRKAVALAERAQGAEPDNADFRDELEHIQEYLAIALANQGRAAEAVDARRRAIRAAESLMEAFPDVPEYRSAVCWISGNLADTLRTMGRLDEAEACLRRAIELAKKHDPTGSYWGVLYEKLGTVCHDLRRDNDAAEAFREAGVRYEKEDRLKPDVIWQKRLYASFLTRCPAVQFRDSERAIVLAKQALQAAPQVPEGWQILGEAEYRAGHWEAAIEALDHETRLGTKDSPGLALYLAMAKRQLGRRAEARRLYDQAVGWIKQRPSRDEDLLRLRAEAAALLGLPEPVAPAKKEVPRPSKR